MCIAHRRTSECASDLSHAAHVHVHMHACAHTRCCVDAILSSKFVCMCVKYRRDGHARWTTSPADVFSQSYSAASTCCRACVRKSTSKRWKLSWESASPRFFFARPRLFVRHGLSVSKGVVSVQDFSASIRGCIADVPAGGFI